jgi:hypothetical protein
LNWLDDKIKQYLTIIAYAISSVMRLRVVKGIGSVLVLQKALEK